MMASAADAWQEPDSTTGCAARMRRSPPTWRCASCSSSLLVRRPAPGRRVDLDVAERDDAEVHEESLADGWAAALRSGRDRGGAAEPVGPARSRVRRW